MKEQPLEFYGTLGCLSLLMTLPATPALAYIGPGAGAGVIAIAVALVVGGLLLVVGLVWYPLKRLLAGRRRQTPGTGHPDSDTTAG